MRVQKAFMYAQCLDWRRDSLCSYDFPHVLHRVSNILYNFVIRTYFPTYFSTYPHLPFLPIQLLRFLPSIGLQRTHPPSRAATSHSRVEPFWLPPTSGSSTPPLWHLPTTSRWPPSVTWQWPTQDWLMKGCIPVWLMDKTARLMPPLQLVFLAIYWHAQVSWVYSI